MHTRRNTTWLGTLLVLGLVLVAPAASAQVPPELPPLPQPPFPPQTQPVFEIIAPTVFPQCGTATVGVFVARQTIDDPEGSGVPPQVLDPLPPELQNYPYGAQLLTATSPFFAICGATPRPEQQLTCLVDLQAQEVVSTIARQAGAALPLGLHPEGDAVEQVIVVEDRLPPPANGAGAGQLASQFLVCSVNTQTSPPQGDYSSQPSYTPPPTQSYAPPPFTPGSFPGFIATPGPQLPPAPPAVPGGGTNAVGDAVTYAVVWLLPLAMLVFGGYFGGALTREITLSPGRG